MEALRCPPDDADVTTLSGGEARRVPCANWLLKRLKCLLLDESDQPLGRGNHRLPGNSTDRLIRARS